MVMIKRVLALLGSGALAILLLRQAETAAQAVRDGIQLCLTSVIPALFPFFAASQLLVSLGAAEVLGRAAGPLFRRLFGMGGAGASAFLLGLIGGYPVGAKTTESLVRQGLLTPEDGALLLTTYRLPDMTGEELASRLGEAADVVMIVPQDYEGEEAENVIMLHNPISQDALVQSLKTLAHCRLRMQQLRARAEKLSRTLEERKLIDRAKGKLMDTLHLTESEAHYRIQKASMDSGRRIADVAREILDSAENLAS